MNTFERICDEIWKERIMRSLSQIELSEKTGVDSCVISRIENKKDTALHHIKKLCKYLKIEITDQDFKDLQRRRALLKLERIAKTKR